MDALTILIGVAILYVISGLIRKRRQNLPPGPLGLPFFGNIFQLDRKKPFKTFTSWIPKYGDIFCVRMLKTDVVVVNSYELIFESLFTKGEDFASRPYSLRNNLVVGLVNNIAFAPYSEKFIFMKRLAAQAIRVHAIAPLEETSRDIIREMINGMQKFVHDGSALDLSPCLHRCIAAIIMSMVTHVHFISSEIFLYSFCNSILLSLPFLGMWYILQGEFTLILIINRDNYLSFTSQRKKTTEWQDTAVWIGDI